MAAPRPDAAGTAPRRDSAAAPVYSAPCQWAAAPPARERSMDAYMALAAAGRVVPDDIDDFVDDWHDSGGAGELGDFLGMTRAEYAAWAEAPDTLPLIILARRRNLALAPLLQDSAARAQAAQACDAEGMAALEAWLAGRT